MNCEVILVLRMRMNFRVIQVLRKRMICQGMPVSMSSDTSIENEDELSSDTSIKNEHELSSDTSIENDDELHKKVGLFSIVRGCGAMIAQWLEQLCAKQQALGFDPQLHCLDFSFPPFQCQCFLSSTGVLEGFN